MLSNSPDTWHAQLETHVTAMSEEELLVLEEIMRTGMMDLVDLAKHPRVAFVLQPVWYRANRARISMVEGDQDNLIQLSRLSGPPTKALMDAMAELVPKEKVVIRMWTWQDPKKGHLGCGCVCGPCGAIMWLGARRGDVPRVIDGVAVSVQWANSTYPAGLHDHTTGDSLEDLAGMRVPHTLENIQ
jgi:hypothetical protein